MNPNVWKPSSVILITAIAIWYASFHDPVGVFLGVAVAWRYLIGDLQNQDGIKKRSEEAECSTRYPCQGCYPFDAAMAADARNQGAESYLDSIHVAQVYRSSVSESGMMLQSQMIAWDRLHVGDQLVRVGDVLEMLEQLVEVEMALDRDSQAIQAQ